jgi:signal transduction histidine kinase
VEQSITQSLQSGRAYDLRFRVRLPEGGDRHIHSTGNVLYGADHTPQRLIGLCMDVTQEWVAEAQRKQTQENLHRSEEHLRLTNAELQRAGRLKDEFLANMSHELRTPLNAILVLSESLQEEVYGPLNSRQRQALNDVVESGQHLLALINDILDLSKIEAGKMDLQYNDVSIADVCQASLRLVRELAGQKQQALSLQLAPEVSRLWADERRLKQMLVNLLSNAVKFTPAEGRIGLDVGTSPTGAEACFTVWDTGIGIAGDRLPHLFQPFAQLDSALNRQYGGTGLGLALVRRLAELHGGRVEVQSAVQAGSRFTVVLPAQPPGLASTQPSSLEGEGRP